MAKAEEGLTTEFATTYREMMLQGLGGEVKRTKRVIAAIPEGRRDYRPDPNAQQFRGLRAFAGLPNLESHIGCTRSWKSET